MPCACSASSRQSAHRGRLPRPRHRPAEHVAAAAAAADDDVAILVDDLLWWRHDRHWCHMVSDRSHEELHVFAKVLGVPERGFHRDHYDIPSHIREAALDLGALAVSSRELVRRLREAGLRTPPGAPSVNQLG